MNQYGTPNPASFVAITRLMGDELQLLVEYDSPKHDRCYHAIGGKQLAGESPEDTINREIAEECGFPDKDDPSLPGDWLELDDSHVMGRIHHPEIHSSSPMEFNTYYLYPVNQEYVYSRDAEVRWVSIHDLSPIDCTHALDDVVMLLRGLIKKGHPLLVMSAEYDDEIDDEYGHGACRDYAENIGPDNG